MTFDTGIDSGAEQDDLVSDLKRLRERCGHPTYQQISDISQRLGELYGTEHGFQSLSVTTISEILKRRRKPKWERVRSFVLACKRYAFESNGLVTDPGPSALPDWFARFAPRDGHTGRQSTESHPYEELVLRVLHGRGLLPAEPYGLAGGEPVELDKLLDRLRIQTTDPVAVTARRYRDTFGHPHIIELLQAAHNGDWYTVATRQGHPSATGQFEDPPAGPERQND